MKTSRSLCVVVPVILWTCSLHAQITRPAIPAPLPAGSSQSPVAVEIGPHHRVWRRISSDGAGNTATNAYTELATGLNHWNQSTSAWEESKEQFVITPQGYAVATNGQHQAILAPNINSGGSVDLLTPDGKRFLSNPMGLSFFDTATGTNVLIAEVKDCIGKFIPPNVILYEDAFTDIKGSIRYTYTIAGFEQDVLIDDSSGMGSPTDYGLNPATSLLEMYSEFHQAPTPEKTTLRTASGLPDETLDFGQMGIGRGKAFELNNTEQSIQVAKAWQVISGRTFMIESMSYLAAKPFLDNLQASVSAKKPTKVALSKAPDRRTLIAMDAMRQRSQTKQVASIQPGRASAEKGFVIDYLTLNTGLTNYTMQGNVTYYISGPSIMSGSNTVFEAGAVIKFAPTNSAKLTIRSPIDWQGSAYRPVIITARDDSTVGDTITTSPVSGYYAETALDIDALAAGTNAVMSNLRISFAKTAIALNGSGHVLSHIQLVNCQNGFQPSSADFSLRNALLNNVLTNFNGSSSTGRCEHLTVHGANWFNYNNTCAALSVTNSLLVCVTNLGTFTGDSVTTLTSDVGVFQQVGAGYHYLAVVSPYRKIGSQNINSNLLNELRQRTTFPPLVRTNHFTNAVTLVPQAQRESGAPDIGYAYDPLDYCWSGLNLTNSTLVLTNGVAVGFYGAKGTILQSAAKFISEGSPTLMNRLTPYSTVQEQAVFWGSTDNSIRMLTINNNPTVLPEIQIRFTHAPSCAGDSKYYFLDAFINPIGSFSLSECYVQGSWIFWKPNADSRLVTLALTNNVFERVNCQISFNSATVTPTSVYLRNNLIYKGQINLSRANTNGTWGVFENLFYNFSYNYGSNPFPNGYNGYWSGGIIPNSIGGDIYLPNTPKFLSGPLGKFYYPTNDGKLSLLINGGSRTADQAGLYHHTVRADQTEEGNSTVDIGYHYIAITPPLVSLTSPLNNSVFTSPANISLAADASDSYGTIAQIEFFRGSNSLGVATTPPYMLTWSHVASGSYELTARAKDNFGLVSTSSVANITVDVPPTVSITSPADNSAFTAPAGVTLEASAFDSDGSITKVEFFEGGTNRLGESTSVPYALTWTDVPAGSYSLTARATDNLGATTTSSAVTVMITAPLANMRLGYWRFECTNWIGEQAQVPMFFTNVQNVLDGSNKVLQVDASGPANLKYLDLEMDGSPNIDIRNGSVLFWFKPDWTAAGAGGTGPGTRGQLLSLGRWTSDASYGCWNLSITADGSSLDFISQTNGSGSTNLTAAINWSSNDWHQIALTYTPSNSVLYIDAELVTTGSAVAYYPEATVRANDGFNIGSDRYGNEQARGQFDELETFNYPLGASEVWQHYDGDADGLNDLAELRLGTNPNNPDTDGDGVNDYLERIQGRNPLILGTVTDTNGVVGLQVYTPLK